MFSGVKLSMGSFVLFQWTEDGQGFQIQCLTLDTGPGSPIGE